VSNTNPVRGGFCGCSGNTSAYGLDPADALNRGETMKPEPDFDTEQLVAAQAYAVWGKRTAPGHR
jgi:hypothetical protein